MILAYYDHFSLISIGIILLFITFTLIGFFKGFMAKFINIANALCGFIFSIMFAGKFSNAVIYKIWGSSLSEKFKLSLMKKAPETVSDTQSLLKELGIPNFISKMISSEISMDAAYTQLGEIFAKIICVIIAFLVLFFGVTILCFILKIIVKLLRKVTVIRIVDGILGVIFYDLLLYLGICVILVVTAFIMQTNSFDGFHTFVTNDMCLTGSKFRISKSLYENNIIGNILRIFF